MKPLFYFSDSNPRLKAIIQVIENLTSAHRDSLPNGWHAIVKMQNEGQERPNYHLDLESSTTALDPEYATAKMNLLEKFPTLAVSEVNIAMAQEILSELGESHIINTGGEHTGRRHWHGGIRIPCEILTIDVSKKITPVQGEIRIAFSGAEEWQDVYFALQIFRGIQVVLGRLWDNQIWYDLCKLKDDPIAGFWLDELKVKEAPLIW